MTVPGAPQILPQENLLLFLREEARVPNGYAVVGFAQGKFTVAQGPDGKKVATQDLSAVNLAKADVVICSSETLRRDKERTNPNAFLVQHGVDLEHFAKAFDPTTIVPDDVKNLPGPVIGFWGLIADWVDLRLIRHVADAFSGASKGTAVSGSRGTNGRPSA